uniref:Uncharacterized protein n=1 Tax=Rhizobium phage LG08 TaxID=3129229 RepID=A0AAU8HY73_9CAUD
MKVSFWNGNHKLSKVVHALDDLVDNKADFETGEIKGSKNKHLNNFRKASNAYYDIFNNGGMNRARLINSIFGLSSSRVKTYVRCNMWDMLMDHCDPIVENLVKLAAEEQGIEIND